MRLVRRIVMVASLVAAALGLGVVMLLALLHTDAGRELARARLASLAASAVAGRVSVGALETPKPGTIVLRDVVVSRPDYGVVRARRIAVGLGLPLPFPPTVRLRSVHIDRLVAHLVRPEEARDTAAREAARLGLHIADLTMRDGRLAMRVAHSGPVRHVVLARLSARGALRAGPGGFELALASLEATPRGVALEPITAAFTLQLPSGGGFDVVSLALASGATRLVGAAAVDPGGRVDAHLEADPLAPSLLAPVAPDVTLPAGSRVALRVRGPRAALDVNGEADLSEAGRIALRGRIDAAGGPATYRAALVLQQLAPGALRAGWPAEPIDGALRASGRGTRLRAHGRLSAPSLEVAFGGRAAVGETAFTRLRATGNVRDLARLGGPAGHFAFRLDAEGNGALPRPPRARASVELGAGTIGAFAMTSASVRAHLDRSLLRVQELRLDGSALRLTADARADVDRGTLDADVDLRSEGRGAASATLALARQRGAWTGTLRAVTLTPEGLAPWSSEAPATFALGGGASIDQLRLRSAEQRAVLSASVAEGGALSGTLAVNDLQLAAFCTLVGASCSGVADGRLEVAGRAAAPRISLAAAVRELAAGPLGRSRLDAGVQWEGGRASGQVTIGGLGGSVLITGDAPVPLPGLPTGGDALDVTITARNLALTRMAQWAPQVVRAASGTVRADLHLGGTWRAPRPEGTLALQASVLQLAASGARWQDLIVELRADGARGLLIERLTADGGEGTVTGTGRLDFDGSLVPSADVRLQFDRFLAVARPVLDATVDGRLRVSGLLTAPTVRGRLYVPEGAVRPAFLPSTNAPTQRDPTIEVVGLPEDVTTAPAPGMGELTLGLTVTLGDGVRILRRDANIQLGGTLHLERTPPEALTVRGTVRIERGWYTFSGRRFTMRSGEVRFDGGPVDDAELDLEAMRRTGEYDVTIAVQGTIGRPELLLSSDPPLDETDVLAVLLIGRPSGELSDAERLQVQGEAASLAMGYVIPGLSGGLGEVLPFEQVDVGPEQIRVSQHIGNDVFVSLSQQFVGWAGQTMAVEYSITRRLSVELSTSSRGSGAIDFFWRRRY